MRQFNYILVSTASVNHYLGAWNQEHLHQYLHQTLALKMTVADVMKTRAAAMGGRPNVARYGLNHTLSWPKTYTFNSVQYCLVL
jgi:hypothetical protein